MSKSKIKSSGSGGVLVNLKNGAIFLSLQVARDALDTALQQMEILSVDEDSMELELDVHSILIQIDMLEDKIKKGLG